MIKKSLVVVICSLVLLCNFAEAQLVINNSLAPSQWVQDYFAGQGVSVSNVTYQEANLFASGVFSGNTNIGFNSGIIITNGIDTNAIGPNNSSQCGGLVQSFNTDDPDIGYIQNQTLHQSHPGCNASILEFDFIPRGDSINLRYIFASEEYNEINDLWPNHVPTIGILLSGPGVAGYACFTNNARNLAIVPDTTLSVTTITINNGIAPIGQMANGPCYHCAYYVDNALLDPLDSTRVQYDGFTVPMRVSYPVIACATYHLKIGIQKYAVPFSGWDSGLFLEAQSLKSPVLTFQTIYENTPDSNFHTPGAIEGCRDVLVKFKMPYVKTDTQFIHIDSIRGNAIFNVDYHINSANFSYHPVDQSAVISISPNQNSIVLTITAVYDGLTEGTEYIKFYFSPSSCSGVDSIIIPIIDYQNIEAIVSNDTLVCGGKAKLMVTPDGGIQPYMIHWSPGATLNDTTIFNPIASPTNTTTYFVVVKDSTGCSAAKDSVLVRYGLNPIVLVNTDPNSGCEPLSVTFTPQSSTVYTYFWDFGDGDFSTDSIPMHIYNYSGSDMIVSLVATSIEGCLSTDTLPPIHVFPLPTVGFNAIPPSANIVLQPDLIYPQIHFQNTSSLNATHFLWHFGDSLYSSSTQNSPDFTYYHPGIYSVWLVASTDYECKDSISTLVTITQDIFHELTIPNIVTPNSDGKNDFFEIENSQYFTDCELTIYNRWGKQIFKSTHYTNNWPDKEVSDGTYFYELSYKSWGIDKRLCGAVTVLK